MATTVSTPAKWPGRAAPSHRSAVGPGTMRISEPVGYITASLGHEEGVHAALLREAAVARQVARVAGQVLVGPNWSGLTKMLMTTASARRRASSTRARWPSWRYPIVGTSAMRRPATRVAARTPVQSSSIMARRWPVGTLSRSCALARDSVPSRTSAA